MHYKSAAYRYFGLALITIIVSFFFCKNKSATVHSTGEVRDTSKILACYIHFKTKEIRYDMLYMVTKDTFVFKSVDSLTQKKQLTRDTLFFVPDRIQDSTVNGKVKTLYIPVPRESVSIERNVDSAVNILSRWILLHPQFFQTQPAVPVNKKDSVGVKDSIK